jgi:hypothetical protein
MRVLLSLAAVLALAVGLNMVAADPASAWCGWRCRAVIAAPVVVVPDPVPVAVPAPCAGGCGGAAYGGAAYYYAPRAYYSYYAYPTNYYNGCNAGPGNCYWRRDCWYDAFGRRFCN